MDGLSQTLHWLCLSSFLAACPRQSSLCQCHAGGPAKVCLFLLTRSHTWNVSVTVCPPRPLSLSHASHLVRRNYRLSGTLEQPKLKGVYKTDAANIFP
jgi:hypothetical protein